MGQKFFSLEMRDENRLTKIFQVILGIACIGIAGYWFIFDFKTGRSGISVWATKIFLVAFGSYMVWTGFGFGYRFIEFPGGMIRLRKNSFLSTVEIMPGDVDRIDLFPLKFTVYMKNSGTILTRFGVSDTEKIELIKDEIIKFASDYNIPLDIKNEL